MAFVPQPSASSAERPEWRWQAARALDELKGGVCLSFIFATLLSLAGLRQEPCQWLCLVGPPAWIGLNWVKLL